MDRRNGGINECIKHIDEYGNEYWETRELMTLLEYNKQENFHKVIKKARIACETSNNMVIEHFPEFRKPIVDGNGNVQVSIYTHYKVGKAVRETIKQLGDTMPE